MSTRGSADGGAAENSLESVCWRTAAVEVDAAGIDEAGEAAVAGAKRPDLRRVGFRYFAGEWISSFATTSTPRPRIVGSAATATAL
jgi:hypothetical protein